MDCPAPAYPVGIDAGAVQVRALLRVDPSGRVTRVSELDGPEPFVSLVAPLAEACVFTPATEDGLPIAVDLPFAWTFDEPPISMEGVLRSRGDRRPAAGLVVDVGGRTATTDETGQFELRNLPLGELEIRLVSDTLRLPETRVVLSAGEALTLELWAFRENQRVNELVATYDPRAVGPTRRTLDRETTRAIPGSLGDPVRALQTQPGFSRTPFDAGWLLVRGGDFDDTGVYLDGVRMPLLFHMGGFTSVLHPELTDTIHYWAGAPPARFQGTAGAVNVLPADAEETAKAVAGVNLAWAHAFASTPIKNGSIALAARRSYLDGVVAAAFGPEAASIAPRFADVQGRMVLNDSSITVLGLVDSLDAPSVTGGTLTVSQSGWQVQGRFPLDLGAGKLVVYPWVATQLRGLTGDVSEDQKLRERFPGVRIAYESDRTSTVRWDTGLEAELRSWTLFLGTRELQHPAGRLDPWIQASAGRKVVFESGLRLDTLWVRDQLPRAALSPRTSVRWLARDTLSLHFELGRFHGSPYPTLLIGLPDGAYLPLEQSDTAGVGFRASHRAWTFEGDVYQRQMAHLGLLELDGTVVETAGRAHGLEAQVAWNPEPIALSVLYQLTRTERLNQPGDPVLPAATDQPHRLQILQLSRLPRNWTLSSRFRYGSGFPRYYDEESGVWEPEVAVDLLTQQDRPTSADPLAPRLAPFYALDVRISRTFQFKAWQLDAYLDIQNLTNRRVPEPLITGFGESDLSYGFGLPVLPLFGVEGVFWPGQRDAPP